jgi:site-specific recombinase XerD
MTALDVIDLNERLPVLAAPQCNPAAAYLLGLSPGSRASMRTALRTILELLGADPDYQAFPWHGLRRADTAAIRSALAFRPSERTGRPYAPRTANHALAALRGVLKEAWRAEMMSADDYHRAVDIPRIPGSRLPAGRALTSGEIRALFAACAADRSAAGQRDAAIIAVLYGCGLRRAELAALQLDAYDETTGDLRVIGKGDKERLVPVTGGAVAAIAVWQAVRGEAPGCLFLAVNKGGVIGTHGITGQAIAAMLDKRAKAARVAPFTPHDLRRTTCSDLLDAGADLAVVQRIMGHANPETTAGYDRRPAAVARKAAGLLVIPFEATA